MMAKLLPKRAAAGSFWVAALEFLADGMLGKLARWLRMLGHDVKYSTKLRDAELLEIAKAENRILLTHDLQLYQQAATRGIEAFYVEGQTEAERLSELACRYNFPLEINMDKSYCPKCNTKLAAATKAEIQDQVEKNTFLHYDNFWKCPNCKQIYWQGAHWKQITNTLKQAQQKGKNLGRQ
jgi:uncharacterized protein